MIPRALVFDRKRELSLIERRLTEEERAELAGLNARISYVLNEDCVCPECQFDPPGHCEANETLSCPCPCHGDDGALAVDGKVWTAEDEGNREGCTCWGSNAMGHTDSDCPLGTG